MSITFGEKIAEGVFSRYEGELLASERSEFQKIDVYDHPFFGRVLTLDDLIQTTTRDEFAQFNADEIKRWGQIVRGLGIQLNQ